MRTAILISLIMFPVSIFAQDKYDYVYYNKLVDISGTNYVVATISNLSKIGTNGKYLAFVDTEDGSINQVDFNVDSYIGEIQQVRIDSIGLNKIIISTKTVDLDGKNSIDWNDPLQIMVLSTNGKERVVITPDNFFVSTWVVNKNSGKIVITGHFDTNENGKYDKKDKHKILVYDLLKMATVNEL